MKVKVMKLSCAEVQALEQSQHANGNCKYPWYETDVNGGFFVTGVDGLTPPAGLKAKHQKWKTRQTVNNGEKGILATRIA